MSTWPNAYHYLFIAKENPSAPGTPVAAQKGIRFEDFDPGMKKEIDEDHGHSGARNTLIARDPVKAYSEPNATDRLRPDDALGYLLDALYGKDTVTRNIPDTGLSYAHTFTEDTLGTYTLTEGFNVGSETAKTIAGAQCNSLEFKFSMDSAPRVTPSFIGGYPVYGVTEPTITYSTTKSIRASQLDVFCDNYNGGTIGTTLLPGFREATITVNNGLNPVVESDDDFGETSIDQDKVSLTANLTRRYDGTDYERIYATGAADGTTPTTDALEKILRFKYTGALIETTYPYIFQFDILHADVEVKSTRSGDGMKMENWTITGLTNASGFTSQALLQNKVASYEYVAP